MDIYHLIMLIIIILLLFGAYRFWEHYICHIKYECKIIAPSHFKTSNLFKTGDLVLFKSLKSPHIIFTNSYFSHMGIIIMIDHIPNVLELQPGKVVQGATYLSGVKLYPLEDRIKFYTEGSICIKPLNKPIDSYRLSLLPDIINWAKTVKYNDDPVEWLKEYCINNIWDNATELPYDCAKFIAKVLHELRLFNKEDLKRYTEKNCSICSLNKGCNLVNYFEETTELLDGYSYGPVYNVCCKIRNMLNNYDEDNDIVPTSNPKVGY